MGEILKRDSVSYRGPRPAPPRPAPRPAGSSVSPNGQGDTKAEHAPRGPVTRLLQVGGEVRALEVRCRCGETIVVELDYPEDQARGASDR